MALTEIIVVGIMALVVGLIIGFILTRFKFIDRRLDKDKNKLKILYKPEELVKKLNENVVIDEGQRVRYQIQHINGVQTIIEKRSPVDEKQSENKEQVVIKKDKGPIFWKNGKLVQV